AASGRYSLLDQRGRIDYRLDTKPLGYWLDLAVDRGATEEQIWLPRAGLGEVEGSLLLSSAGWSSRLELQLRDVLMGEITAPRLGGALTLSGRGVRDMRLDLVRPQGAISIVGDITLGEVGQPAGLDLNLEIDGWPGAEIGRQVELPWSVEGSTTASVALRGTTEELTGRASWTLLPGEVAGIPVSAVEGEMRIEPGALELERLDLRLAGGVVEVRGRLPLEGDGIELTFASSALDLAAAPFDGWLPAATRGTLSLAGRFEGSFDRPQLILDLDVDGLVYAGREATTAPTRLSVRWLDHRLTVEGSVGELLTIAGGGQLDRERADLDLSLESGRLGGLLAGVVAGELAGLGGRFSGGIRLRGPLAGIEPEISIDELELTYGEHRLAALEPITARWRDGALEVSSLFLGDEATGSELFVFGRVPIDEAESLDLRLQMSIDTQWLELLLPDWQFEGGRFDGLATVGGSFGAPLVNGQGGLRQERIRLPGLIQSVEQANAVFLFYPEQVVIDDAEARFAGGRIRIAGTVEPFAEPALEYRFQVVGQDLQLRYPEGWQIHASGDLVISSVVDGRQIRGRVTLARATFTEDVPVGITQLIRGAFERRPEVVEEADELFATTQLNIAVVGPEALRIRNNVADLRGDVDLVVRGSLARPVIFGDVRIEAGGTLLYSGNEYEVLRAELKFVNPYRIQPVVDLEATTRLREYDINLNLSGTLERLDVGFVSNPPLAGLDVLSLLAGGEELVASADARAGGVAESFLYGQATSVVAERVNRLFGLDKFRIDPLIGDSGDLSSARVTVGERLSRDLFATYSYDPSKTELQILQLEWQVSRQLTLVATQNGDSSYAIDVRWEKSF
ncbi:MAG: translocation/assembly module TamB domain-containing protein, partial [Acidobacteria bacterium]|nr:translocation/assembly module TamB domain-containing protein [Acidobacteriota bacterium]